MNAKKCARFVAVSALLSTSIGSMSIALADSPHSFSANIGVVSNYMWRGVTQTGDQAAVQGGIDYSHASGFYAGTWASNVDWDEGAAEEVIIPVDENGDPATDDFGNLIGMTSGADSSSPNYELDFYLGYGGQVNDDFSYDVGTIYYAYPDGRDSDFWEIYASGTYKWFTLGIAYTPWGQADDAPWSDGDLYYSAGAEFSLPYELGLALRGGYYDFKNDGGDLGDSADYGNWGVAVSREAGDFGTFSLNYDQNNGKSGAGYDNDPKFWVGWTKEF